MGKIRVKTLGDEEQEKEQQKKAQRKAEGKKQREEAEEKSTDDSLQAAADSVIAIRQPAEKQSQTDEIATAGRVGPRDDKKKEQKDKKPKKKFDKNKKVRSDRYASSKALVDVTKIYPLAEALELLSQVQKAKFDETVELHINTLEAVSGSLNLPHGTGKKTRVVIADSKDAKELEELTKKVESGVIEFDVLVSTPDAMPKLAKVARYLGPRGLMPNPKTGTVTPKPEEVAQKFAAGQTNYKTEAKAPILHLVVGKMSFGNDKLTENIKTVISAVQPSRIKNVTIKSTMSPGIKILINS